MDGEMLRREGAMDRKEWEPGRDRILRSLPSADLLYYRVSVGEFDAVSRSKAVTSPAARQAVSRIDTHVIRADRSESCLIMLDRLCRKAYSCHDV